MLIKQLEKSVRNFLFLDERLAQSTSDYYHAFLFF